MDDSLLRPPQLARLGGGELFKGVDATVLDFWRWALGDLRMNSARGYLAEFLVANAVGSTEPQRVEWGPHDVTAPDGTRIEVKSAAYLQSWAQRKLSTPRFSLKGAKLIWNSDSGSWTEPLGGRVDVWVFALQTCTDHTLYDPLTTEQWTFWVLPARVIDELGQAGAGLSTIQRIGGEGVAWKQLDQAVAGAAYQQRTAGAQTATSPTPDGV